MKIIRKISVVQLYINFYFIEEDLIPNSSKLGWGSAAFACAQLNTQYTPAIDPTVPNSHPNSFTFCPLYAFIPPFFYTFLLLLLFSHHWSLYAYILLGFGVIESSSDSQYCFYTNFETNCTIVILGILNYAISDWSQIELLFVKELGFGFSSRN